MIGPAGVPFLGLLLAISMAISSPIWAVSLVQTVWIVILRRASYPALLVGLAALIGALLFGSLYILTRAWLPAGAAVLTIWATPFLAVPALNALARHSSDVDEPVPERGAKLKLSTFIFDAARSQQRAAYEPPPLAEEP